MSKILANHSCSVGRDCHFATECVRLGQCGHRQYIDRHRSAGRSRGMPTMIGLAVTLAFSLVAFTI
jgi:hypothetical protein